MSHERDGEGSPSEPAGPVIGEENDNGGEGNTDAPLTPEQQRLVRTVDGLVERRVAWHLSRFPLAMHIAEDLVATGKREVTEASRRYKARYKTAFSTYVRYALDGAILDAMGREARQQKLRFAGEACLRMGALAHPLADEDTLDPMVDDEIGAERKLCHALGGKALGAALAFAFQLDEMLEQQVDPERVAALRRLGGALREALSRLPARDQQMLRCLYAGGMDLGEVAELLGLAYPTIKVRHSKVLGMLRDDLTTQGFSSSSGGE